MLQYWQTAAITLAASYVVMAFLAWLLADGILYQPPPPGYGPRKDITMLRMADGTGVAALHIVVPDSHYTIFYLHGNAEDIAEVEPTLREFARRGFSVFCFDYRGYGLSGGKPAEDTIKSDSEECLKHLVDTCGVPLDRIVLYGRSLGGGPAIHLAAKNRVAGLILHSAFLSAYRTVTRWPVFPGDRFNNAAKMGLVDCRVLIIHGTRDRTVPFSHGRRLYDLCTTARKGLWVEGAGHNDIEDVAGGKFWQVIEDWMRGLPR